jgi:hypothetical protein
MRWLRSARASRRIDGFEVIADSFDYAPTGETAAGMWSGDDTVKRNMVKDELARGPGLRI